MKKNLNILYTIATLSILHSSPANATVVVVDPADNSSISFNHLGNDILYLKIYVSGGVRSMYTVNITGDENPTIGTNFGTLDVYTQGQDIEVNAFFSTDHVYYNNSWGRAGSMPGVNYIRLDLDGNSLCETVVELNFGPDYVFSDDVITRYVYESSGASLNISEAVDALNGVPEPSSTLLIGLGFMVSALKRSRR